MAKQTLLSGDTLPSMTVKVNAMHAEQYDHRGHNILDYGDIGTIGVDSGNNDDTDALEAAIAAANAADGRHLVQIPGGRTYSITREITVPNGIRIEGLGVNTLSENAQCPRLSWYGAAGGTMFLVDAEASNNLVNVVFRDLNLYCEQVNRPATFIKYYSSGGGFGKCDTGCYLQNVGFYGCTSHAVHFADGATNMYIHGCRWDFCGTGGTGYGVYVALYGGFNCHFAGHCTYTAEDGAGGFLFLNCEGQTGGVSLVQLDALKVEINDNDLGETYPAASGAANPYDQRGLIRFGVDDEIGQTSHTLTANAISVESITGHSSFCVFQITANESISDDVAATYVNILVDGAHGLGLGTNDAATDDQIRPIGGRVPTAKRVPAPLKSSARWGRFQFGDGVASTAERVVNWINAQHWYQSNLNLCALYFPKLLPFAFDVINSVSAEEGMIAWCTDVDTGVTAGTVLTGSNTGTAVIGVNQRLITYNGTNWILERGT